MFSTQWIFGLVGAEEVMALRREVNVVKKGIPEDEEFDWFDGIAAHLVVREDGKIPAVGRIYPDGELTRIDRITVAPGYEGKLYDDLVLRVMLDKSASLPGKTVAVFVETDKTAYYERFGFNVTSTPVSARGGTYVHMTAAREDVKLPSDCKGH